MYQKDSLSIHLSLNEQRHLRIARFLDIGSYSTVFVDQIKL